MQLDYGLEFYSEVASRSDLSLTFRLSHEGRTVAMLFGLIDRNCFRYLILACDYARYAEFSPGLLIFDRAIAYWAQRGGEVFDFTIGDEPYKEDLACTSTPMFAFSVRFHASSCRHRLAQLSAAGMIEVQRCAECGKIGTDH